MDIVLQVILLFAFPAAFVGMYLIFARREKPVADADAYAKVLRAHREAGETLGGSVAIEDELLKVDATVDGIAVAVRTKVGIGFIPKETAVSCARGADSASFVRHNPRCDGKHPPRQPPSGGGAAPAELDGVLAFYCTGRGERVWLWRRGGERDAACLVAAVRAAARMAATSA